MSSQGQVTIPQILRDQYHWEAGQELIIINLGDWILLKPKKTFPETTLDEVAGCLKYQGKAKTIEEMDQAIAQGIEELWNQWLLLEICQAFRRVFGLANVYLTNEKRIKKLDRG